MITSIASQKGGTGKTTTSISVATGLARCGKRVLLIDMDSQANSSKVLLPDYLKLRKEDTIFRTILENSPIVSHKTSILQLEIAPSHILLSNTDIELTTAKDHREARLKKELDKIKENYDFVIIDCPPGLPSCSLMAHA
jgi:chromosome partitioning protein